MKQLRLSLIVCLGLATSLGWGLPIYAAGGLGISPKPTTDEPSRSWFIYTLNPGTSQTDTVVINNNSEKSMTVAVEGLDAINTAEGGFTLIDSASQNKDLGLWVTPSASSIQIPAGKSAEVEFTLKVPVGASPGQHSGAIVVYEKTAGVTGGVGLKIRVGARIYVTVPGKVVRKLTFQKVSHEFKDGKLIFHITARNDSNVNIEPALDINIRSIFGSYHQEENTNGSFLPGNTITLDKTWQRRTPLVGYYRVNLTMHTWSIDEIMPDGSKKTLPDMTFRYSYGFWVGGIYIFLLALLLILAWCGWRLKIYLKDRGKFRTKTEIYTVGERESIIHISERSGTLPQLIVKFNRLVWPYALNAGDKLIIPVRPLTPDELYAKQEHEQLPAIWWYFLSPRPSLYHPTPADLKRLGTSSRAAKVNRANTRGRRKPVR